MPGQTYKTIERAAKAEYKDRGSSFLAYCYPADTVDECKKILKQLKEEHPKAAHHCMAYRIGYDGMNFRASDDGEPSGSAGKPILGQIDSRELTNTLIIVVRYFGGTLLGVPGLINAYKTAASLALQLTPIIEKPIMVHYRLDFEYPHLSDIMTTVKRFGCVIIEQDLQLFCTMTLAIPLQQAQAAVERLKDQGITLTQLQGAV